MPHRGPTDFIPFPLARNEFRRVILLYEKRKLPTLVHRVEHASATPPPINRFEAVFGYFLFTDLRTYVFTIKVIGIDSTHRINTYVRGAAISAMPKPQCRDHWAMAINYSPFGASVCAAKSTKKEEKTNRKSINAIALGMRVCVFCSPENVNRLCVASEFICACGAAAAKPENENEFCMHRMHRAHCIFNVFVCALSDWINCVRIVWRTRCWSVCALHRNAFASFEWEFNAREIHFIIATAVDEVVFD